MPRRRTSSVNNAVTVHIASYATTTISRDNDVSGTISISLSDEVAIFLVFDIGILRKSDSAVLERNGFTESFYYTIDVCLYVVKL